MKHSRPIDDLSGVLVVDKPLRKSSASVVAVVRARAGRAKTGHAGTLDPLATGVLVLALGRATKIIPQLMATDKRYRATIDLSAFTPTDDLEGEREEISVEHPPDEARVRAALATLTGAIMQRPPAHSAIWVKGRRSYDLARRGEAVELPARPVVIHSIELLRYDWPMVELDIHCGKGMYVRSLARSVGEALGTGGHLAALRRTAVGPFTEAMAIPLEDVPSPLTHDSLITAARALEMIEASSPDAG